MPAPPSQADLEALAERALARLEGEGQATAWWERAAETTAGGLTYLDRVRVEVAALGAGLATTDDVSDDGLRATADAARRLPGPQGPPAPPDSAAPAARHLPGPQPPPPDSAAAAAQRLPGPRWRPALPEPAPGRAHDGYDPAAAGLTPERAAEAVAALPPSAHWRSAAAKAAIASTRGVRAYEQRSLAELLLPAVGGRQAFVRAAAVGPARLDAEALAAEFLELAGEGDAGPPAPPGECPVVLGPWAVATLLEAAAWQLSGAVADRFAQALGTRLVSPAINLSDSPRFTGTLPHSYDAEGSPVQPLPLIQDGVAHRVVHDATTAARAGVATTGHATRPAGFGFPRPRNLVLVGGGAADVAELAAGIDGGLLIASLHLREGDRMRACGVRRISAGELGPPAPDATVRVDPFDVLAATDALTSRQWLVPSVLMRSPRDASASVVPALRARAGVRVA